MASINTNEYTDSNARVLPSCYLWNDFLADFAYRLRENVYVVETLNLLADAPAHAAGIQAKDFRRLNTSHMVGQLSRTD